MKNEINELKALIKEADKYHEISLDESLTEEETDAAYGEYWTRIEKTADALCALIKIDRKTALRMAAHKAEDILDLVKRAA